MEICTQTTRETTLSSTALPSTVLPQPTASGSSLWRGQQLAVSGRLVAPVAAFQGGAIAGLGTAADCDITDHGVTGQDVLDMDVTDHTYSFRLGSTSCSPPV